MAGKSPGGGEAEAEAEAEAEERRGERRALRSATTTLCLGIAGSAVLPLAYGQKRAGLVTGSGLMVVAALMNAYTSRLLLECSSTTGARSYGELARLVGGKRLELFTEGSLLVLLFGTLCGNLSVLGEVLYTAARMAAGDRARAGGAVGFVLDNHGQVLLLLVTVAFLLPVSMLKHMKSLEYLANAGFVIVLVLLGAVAGVCIGGDFPALRDGEFKTAVWNPGSLAEAFSLYGFSFYLQPLMMPMLAEMPAGDAGVRLTQTATNITIYGFALTVYASISIFGAAAFGDAVGQNILLTDRPPFNSPGAAALHFAVAMYVASSYPALLLALRTSLDALVAGKDAEFSWNRNVLETLVVVATTLFIAVISFGSSEVVFNLTGAVGVMVVCYALPVFFHLKLLTMETVPPLADPARLLTEANEPAPDPDGPEGASPRFSFKMPFSLLGRDTSDPLSSSLGQLPRGQQIRQALLPVLVLVLGAAMSLIAIVEALRGGG